MRYHDLRIERGRIASRFEHNTDDLGPEALAHFRGMLKQLRRGEIETGHGIPDMTEIALSGMPAELAHLNVPGRFFCLGQPGGPAFSINLLLSAAPERAADDDCTYAVRTGDRDAAALLAIFLISLGLVMPPGQADAVGAWTEQAWALRCGPRAAPVLLTVPGVTNAGDLALVSMAADAATLTAAALMMEDGN